ncbi:peptidase C39 family protein [Nocardioides jiangxiensis]|uniref:Peptidase C39 family protein n=1 Tax=Nocardioides jiangxiensis TaxID=3064524 RepID=A0ABT9B0K4_9ACTN|nr:peptidase C39 family protein [Nocardioides sp. WY-20]MDO7867778.1 peptidase C39 family protein [Nocardioides sp. WY-20]
MQLRRLILDPRLDGVRLRFAVAVTVLMALLAYVALLDGVASRQAAERAHGPSTAASPTGSARAELAASTPARNSYRETTSQSDWEAGAGRGTVVSSGSIRLATRAGSVSVGGRSYDWAAWQSPWVTPGHGFTELVPSWRATTPAGTFLAIQVRAKTASGQLTSWQSFGRWTLATSSDLRRSGGTQDDGLSTVATDTLRAASGVVFSSYTLKVQLYRASGSTATPSVHSLGAVASQLASAVPPVSAPLLGAHALAVPAYSQMIHRGQYPQYGGGGQAWCSPTSLAMVLGYYGVKPAASEYAWVSSSYADPWVDEVARRVFDFAYDGAGNWPFNTAYAGTRLTHTAVTRFGSLRDVEKFIAAGIPVEVSISFSSGQLSGAPISSTSGHLVVVTGFTASGNVLVNDPAASSDSTVKRTYDRAQFEAAWLRRSHGLAYVMRDAAHAFPSGYGLS